jgi:hypothetical protein
VGQAATPVYEGRNSSFEIDVTTLDSGVEYYFKVSAFNDLTESALSRSIYFVRGAQGDPGIEGLSGIRGEIGAQGNRGDRGIKGGVIHQVTVDTVGGEPTWQISGVDTRKIYVMRGFSYYFDLDSLAQEAGFQIVDHVDSTPLSENQPLGPTNQDQNNMKTPSSHKSYGYQLQKFATWARPPPYQP